MRTGRLRRGLGVALGMFTALALASAFTSAAEAKTLNVVVLGDSYAAGTGGGDYEGGACLRGKNFWGAQYAAGMRQQGYTVNLTNNACAGATLDAIPGQLSAITKETDLVLIMIGGNDVSFVGIVFSCYLPFFSSEGNCKTAIDNAKAGIPGVQAKATATLNNTRALLRDGAKVAVVSYPYLTQDNGFKLGSYPSAAGAREVGDLGDQADLAAAAAANQAAGVDWVDFVPTKDLFAGHETNADPWVDNPSRWLGEFSFDFPAIYHPNALGQTGLAQAVLRKGDFGVSR